MKNNNGYWNKVYETGYIPKNPSQFAAFTLNELSSDELKIIDIGCGNGRDSSFFGMFGKKVIGLDASPTVIEINKAQNKNKNVDFIEFDFSKDISQYFSEKIDVVYARFFFHSITNEVQEKVFTEINKISSKESRIFAEFRTERDEEKPKTAAQHFRRFVNSAVFSASLDKFGYDIEYMIEGSGFAKYKNEDAHVCRIIAKRRS